MPHTPTIPNPPRRRSKWVVRVAGVGLLLVIAAELFARFALGLGDPPLYVLDPQIEYLLAPSQNCHRFGNTFRTNRFGMRSDDFPEQKSAPDELRVLVVGDSIINGGARVDQSDLATSVLQRELAASLHRPVVVGNISAGSWGPVNQLAYIDRFGLFGADVVVLVLNTEDAADVPGLEAIGPQWPRHKPLFALQEIGERYFPRIFLPLGGNAPPSPPPIAHTTSRAQDLTRTNEAVRAIVGHARATGAHVIVVRYATRPEVGQQGNDPTPDFARPDGAELAETERIFRASLDRGENPFQPDGVHPNGLGQRLLGRLIANLMQHELQPENQTPADAKQGP